MCKGLNVFAECLSVWQLFGGMGRLRGDWRIVRLGRRAGVSLLRLYTRALKATQRTDTAETQLWELLSRVSGLSLDGNRETVEDRR